MDRESGAPALTWAVKDSLVAYVRGAAGGGSVTPVDGATEPEPGVFAFGLAEPGPDRLAFTGGVQFRAHGGMLDLPIVSPWLERDAAGWCLSIPDPDEAPESGIRLVFARVGSVSMDADGAEPGAIRGSDVTLTEEGAMLFFGPYQHGTPLADLRVAGLPQGEAERLSAR